MLASSGWANDRTLLSAAATGSSTVGCDPPNGAHELMPPGEEEGEVQETEAD
jgi:hypothetical protein